MNNKGRIMKKALIFIIIIILIGAVMYVTNPTMDDFNEYLDNKSERNIEKYSSGTKGLSENMLNNNNQTSGAFSKSHYERTDYYVFSIYESDSSVLTYGNKHLGIFKFFMKLD